MALIRSFSKLTGGGVVHRTETDAGWALVQDGGHRLLYIATYGSDQRQSKPKSSQVIQLDRRGASELLKIIQDSFPGIDDDCVD
ncbi:hypothetical protein [Brachybacterium muris]|uniref:Uncharacterized protein n=1 Tax=Brachybacterium muris UCD-AY4 TaxID=1249481 RepID=A0A022KZW0_9MICO|nr:hypothetical protein [Brachybacterium muris]EYT48918.1 hypothetical protein D641_0109740 [Brachybacterium muris UCD-AY4]